MLEAQALATPTFCPPCRNATAQVRGEKVGRETSARGDLVSTIVGISTSHSHPSYPIPPPPPPHQSPFPTHLAYWSSKNPYWFTCYWSSGTCRRAPVIDVPAVRYAILCQGALCTQRGCHRNGTNFATTSSGGTHVVIVGKPSRFRL